MTADTPYASPLDVQAIVSADEEFPPEPSNPDNPSQDWLNLTTAILEATDLVIGYLEREYFPDEDDPDDPDDYGVPLDVPGAVRRVVARITLRSFDEDAGVGGAESEVNLMGPFSHTVNWSKDSQARSMWLTAGEKLRLDRFKQGYSGRAVHLPMYGSCGAYQTQ
jgi:hypothetical protein